MQFDGSITSGCRNVKLGYNYYTVLGCSCEIDIVCEKPLDLCSAASLVIRNSIITTCQILWPKQRRTSCRYAIPHYCTHLDCWLCAFCPSITAPTDLIRQFAEEHMQNQSRGCGATVNLSLLCSFAAMAAEDHRCPAVGGWMRQYHSCCQYNYCCRKFCHRNTVRKVGHSPSGGTYRNFVRVA